MKAIGRGGRFSEDLGGFRKVADRRGEAVTLILLAEEVDVSLFAPLRASIRNTRLLILPHGDLHHVPFAALRDPHGNRYLIEDYTLTHLPSASALPLLGA